MQPDLILEIAKRAGLEPRKVGQHEWVVRCPHRDRHRNGDEHPSCRLNDEKGAFYCPVCGRGGGVKEFGALLDVDLDGAIGNGSRAEGIRSNSKPRKSLHFESRGPITSETQDQIRQLLNKSYSEEAWKQVGVHEGIVGDLPAIGFPLPGGGWKCCLYTRPNPARSKKYTFWFTDGGKSDLLVVGDGDEVLLAAGEWDMLGALSAGIRCAATGTGGEGCWKDSWSTRFKGKRALIVYDADSAGRAGAEMVSRKLAAAGVELYVVQLPLSGKDDQDGKDLSDFLAIHGAEALRAHLTQTQARGPYRLPEDPPALQVLAGCATTNTLDRIKETLAFVRQDAEPAFKAKTFEGILPFLSQLDPVAQDLAARTIKEELGVGLAAVREEIERYKARTHTAKAVAPNSTEPSPESRALLQDPCLLERFLDDTTTLGLIGEDHNKIALLFIMTSRLSPRPTNAAVKGESAAGKNHLVATVARCFPPDQVINITTLSPQSLSYWDGDLINKILIVAEAEGADRSEYTFRILQSEGHLTVYYVTKVDGELKTVEKTVRGPAATITTTTRESLHPENETRLIELALDESAEQTARITAAQAKQSAEGIDHPVGERIVDLWRGAQALLEPLPVVIPFAPLIQFPTQQVRARRDFPKLLTLIEVSAFLHQFQRERAEARGRTHVVADIRDYAVAYDLLHAFIDRVQSGLNDREARVLGELQRCSPEHRTIRQVAETLGWHQEAGYKRAERCLKRLHDKGRADKTDSKSGVPTEFWHRVDATSRNTGISTPEEIAGAIAAQGGHLPTTWTSPLSRSNSKP